MKGVKKSMAEKNNSALFFLCSLIEYMGRKMLRERKEIVCELGQELLEHIYDYADILHCEPIEKVAYEFIEESGLTKGEFDNVSECQYQVPDYWTIGQVYERLIEDTFEDKDIIKGIIEIYTSWISEHISDYNTDFYYQSREYIALCYKYGEILE